MALSRKNFLKGLLQLHFFLQNYKRKERAIKRFFIVPVHLFEEIINYLFGFDLSKVRSVHS